MDDLQGGLDELLKHTSASDPRVTEAIVQLYRLPIYRLALSILDNPDEAEDAVQDTLIRAVDHLHQYRVGTHFRAWIFTIALNTCRGVLRRRAARENLQKIMTSLYSLVNPAVDPETAMLQGETGSQLSSLVDRLPEKQRLVVILYIVHDLSIPEVAQVLNTHPKTVYSRLYQAFRSLRQQLQWDRDSGLFENEAQR